MSAYSEILESGLLPLHNLFKGRKYVQNLTFLKKSQWWPRDRLLAFQWDQLHSLLAHAFHSVPYYQKKYAKAGICLEDIKTREDFARLPLLTRADVNSHREELCSRAYHGKFLPHATGGSTGVPTRFYRTIESYDWRTAASDRVYSWTGCRSGERATYLWGAPVGDLSRWQAAKTELHHFLLRHQVFNTFSQTEEMWREIFARTAKYKPELIVGYVSSLNEFSRFLRKTGCQLPTAKAVIAAAEPLDEHTRNQIGGGIGAPVFNTYGCREFMSIAGECEQHNGLHINSENILVETTRPSAQGPSEILITDLHNYGMPFIRYSIGDVGMLDDSECACGRGLPKLASVSGRVLDVLRTADGRVVTGEIFPHLLKEVPEIAEYQVEQKSIDRIQISVVLSGGISEKSLQLLDMEFKKVLGAHTKIDLKKVDKIPKLPSGKRRIVIGLSPEVTVSRDPIAVLEERE